MSECEKHDFKIWWFESEYNECPVCALEQRMVKLERELEKRYNEINIVQSRLSMYQIEAEQQIAKLQAYKDKTSGWMKSWHNARDIAKLAAAEQRIARLRKALQGLLDHTKINMQLCGLNYAAEQALKETE